VTTPIAPAQIETTIFEALKTFGADPAALRRDATLEELEVDSLDLVELAQVIEDEYKVEVTSQDVQNVSTVGDVIDLVAARVS
jgi:acyl carrier protein